MRVLIVRLYYLEILTFSVLNGWRDLGFPILPTRGCFHLSTLSDNNFFQLIDSPTRGVNSLDLLFTTIVEGIKNLDVTECEGIAVSSDHKAITFDLHFASRSANNNK